MKSFYTWIKQFKNDDIAVGDLSRDILADNEFPKKGNKDEIKSYLISKNAIDNCISTFDEAYETFLSN